MAFTYLILNFVFITIVLLVFRKQLTKPTTTWWLSLLALLILTAIFDNVMISTGFFSYSPEKILGLSIGLAPIEDFMYAVLAAIIVPLLWRLYRKENNLKKEGSNV